MLKINEMFKIKRHSVFIEEINKIALNSNNEEKMQSNIETYAYGTSKDSK